MTDALDRLVEAQSLARPVVELIGHRVQEGLVVDGDVGALGEVLAQKAIGILIRPTLPGLVRVAEIDLDVCGEAHVLPVAHLGVPGPR